MESIRSLVVFLLFVFELYRGYPIHIVVVVSILVCPVIVRISLPRRSQSRQRPTFYYPLLRRLNGIDVHLLFLNLQSLLPFFLFIRYVELVFTFFVFDVLIQLFEAGSKGTVVLGEAFTPNVDKARQGKRDDVLLRRMPLQR